MITSFTLLTPHECAAVERRVKELRSAWTPRGAQQPSHFYTLGAAAYLDDRADYTERANALNPLLRKTFDELYTKLIDFMTRRLRAPVELADHLALPGFHIWESPAVFTQRVASVHFDLQYLRTWPKDAPGVDFTHPLSFTLAIRLPRQGGGLNVWEITYERFLRFYSRISGRVDPMDVSVLLEPMRHPYAVGGLSIHSGHLLHQIAEIDAVAPEDERITLQGHALFAQGAWRLYW